MERRTELKWKENKKQTMDWFRVSIVYGFVFTLKHMNMMMMMLEKLVKIDIVSVTLRKRFKLAKL